MRLIPGWWRGGAIGGVFAVMAWAALVAGAGAPAEWPQVSAEAVKAYSEYWGGASDVGQLFMWPGSEEKTFTVDQVPEQIREGAAQWIAKILKEEYVESDLAKKMIGVRRSYPKGGEIDELFVRYRNKDAAIQMCDTAVGMSVLVVPTGSLAQSPEDWQGAQGYVTQVFSRFFREPRIPIRYVSICTSWSKRKDGPPVFCGLLSLNPNKDFNIDIRAPRYWFDQIPFLVDGTKVGFSFFKTNGTIEEETAKPPPPAGKRW